MADIEAGASRNIEPLKPKKLIGVRHYQYLIFLLTLTVFFGIYASLSVAIVPMTGETSNKVSEHIDWTNPDTVLSAFFWAHFVPQITGAKLADFYGPKWLLLTTMLVGSVFNIVIPAMFSTYGSSGVIVCRVFQGLCQGYIHPCLNNLINKWTPPSERSRVTTIVYGGATLGTAICMPLAGCLVASETGWPTVFYVFGVGGIIWAIVFAYFGEASPELHDYISEEERNYIEKSTTIQENENALNTSTQQLPTPWLSIVKSRPIWAILVAGSANCWGAYTLLTQIPTYMSNMLDFDISQDGSLSGLPYFAQLGVSLIVVPVADLLLTNRRGNNTTTRKIFNSLGSFIPAIFLIPLAFIDSSQRDAGIALLIVAVGTSVLAQSGYLLNVVDLAPNHMAVLYSMVHSFTSIFSTLGPMTVGFLGSDKKDPVLWRSVFLITASFYIVGGIFYCFFASAEEERWNRNEDEDYGARIKEFFQNWFSRIKNRISCSSPKFSGIKDQISSKFSNVRDRIGCERLQCNICTKFCSNEYSFT